MDLIDPDPDLWTTFQLGLNLVSSPWTCLLITEQSLTLFTVDFLSCLWPGIVSMDMPVHLPHKFVWKSGWWADDKCQSVACPLSPLHCLGWGPCWENPCPTGLISMLPQKATIPCCWLTLAWAYVLSSPARPKARAIRKAELGCAGLEPFVHAARAVNLLFNIPRQPQGLTPRDFKNRVSKRKVFCGNSLDSC